MKKTILTLLLAGITTLCLAGTPPTRHSVRVGWGDMLFETMVFHPTASPLNNWTGVRDNAYTGHIFADYMYSLTDVVSVGIQTDFEGIFWKENGRAINNYNLSFLPAVSFTFLRTEWVNLYAGASVGLLVAFDNQRQAELAPAFNLNLLGVRVGKGNWGGFLELGALSALKSANDIYMLGSRLISVGVNYTW